VRESRLVQLRCSGQRRERLARLSPHFSFLRWQSSHLARCAGATTPLSHEEIAKAAGENQALGRVQVSASGMGDAAIRQVGEKRYFEELFAAWDDLKVCGGVPGLRYRLERGMEEVGCAWKRICDGEIRPDEGLLFEF
jgi:Protein of unknown function (DUF2855)